MDELVRKTRNEVSARYSYHADPKVSTECKKNLVTSTTTYTYVQKEAAMTAQNQLIQRTKITEHKETYFNYPLIFLMAGLTIALIIACLYIWNAPPATQAAAYETTSAAGTEEEPTATQLFDSSGFVFPDISERYLTEAEVLALEGSSGYSQEDLLRLAINDVYAKHGKKFDSNGELGQHYSSCQWYCNTPAREVSFNDFNSYEYDNVNLLVRISRELGYR